MTRLHLAPPDETIAAGPLLHTLAAHAVPGAEIHAGHRHQRLIRTAGDVHAVTVEIRPHDILLESSTDDSAILHEIAGTVRSWLDLDTDTRPIAEHLRHDPIIGPLVDANPGLRIPSYPDGFEAIVMTVLGQQVSLAAGRTFGGRLVAAYGAPGPAGLIHFPTPEALADVTAIELAARVGLTGARARTVVAVAKAFAGGLSLVRGGHTSEFRAQLLDLPGIGPWTVDFLAVRALADPDAFTPGDLILRRALAGVTAREATEVAESWRPWRAYALSYLWASAAPPARP
ncbi:AlkA N-terminal domain-containing protein [Herbiconiux sp. 11R-BC]|uniref:DNA-3-methyladenine glycosylase family protein n=1 Tax=Herbiconiux sp. 11R-BC TaxID=3111637 RepID=UPI003C0397CD